MHCSTITENEGNNDDEKSLSKPTAKNGKNSRLDQPTAHMPGEQPLIWRNIIGIAGLHLIAIYLFVTRYHTAKMATWIFEILWSFGAGFGITAGAHRFWAHRSYKAKLPLRIMIAVMFCMGGMTHPTKWIRVHRTHHRYSDTAADPHNSNRGFFFSHVGWLMMKHHPAVKKYGKNVDMSDIAADPVIRFFDKYYPPIMLTLTFILPALVTVYILNETWIIGIASVIVRYTIFLNMIFSVNSFAHLYGYRPYNRTIKSAENPMVAFLTIGEGWHNYHHTFPWDYKTSEFSSARTNLAAKFIEFMAWLGWAYDLKTSSPEIIDRFCANKGDGTPRRGGHVPEIKAALK